MSLIENKSQRELDERIAKAIAIVSSELLVKASVGAVAQSFDPNAQDGDGDGMVQDGSPFERPAVIKAVSNASQRLGNLLAKASRVTVQSRAREYQRRYSGMSASDIAKDAVPDSFEAWVALTYERLRVQKPDLPPLSADMTPDEVKQTVRALEDFVEKDLVWMLSPENANDFEELKKTDRNRAFRELLDGAFDFSPEAVAKNRELVEHVLTTNPQFRAMVDKFGLPSIVRFGENMDSAHVASGMFTDSLGISLNKFRAPRSKGRLEGLGRGLSKWFMEAIVEPKVGSKRTKRWVSSSTPEALLIHEYGHYLADAIKLQLSNMDTSERTKRWQAWRFSSGSDWKETFEAIGHPEWHDLYKLDETKKKKGRRDVPDEIPHVLTAYGESSPAEAFAEAIAATFALDGRDTDLVSPAMSELINDLLELPQGKSPRENLTPQRAKREIVPDGFASRGSVRAINNERDSRFGDLDDPYELTAEWLGTLDGDDPVGNMVQRIRSWQNRPRVWDKVNPTEKRRYEEMLNIRRANEEEAALIVRTVLDNPAFAEMIRRHGIANMYFSQRNLRLVRNDGTEIDVRGMAMGSFTPDDEDSGRYFPPRIVMDLVGDQDKRTTPDVPTPPLPQRELREWKSQKIPGNVTRSHVSNSDQAVIRHEGGHSIHDMLWERVHRGEIRGRRANLIRAYASSTWEEFYTELGRPDLWEEHQRALRATHSSGAGSKVPSPEIQQIDSAYAWANPREFFAESFTAYTSSNPDQRALMNDTALEHMQAILGDADVPDAGETRDLPDTTPIPAMAAWEGFASAGGPPARSYADVRTDRLREGKGAYSRSELFRNTTTAQKVDLAVPENERDYMLMAWDQVFERMGLTHEEAALIDLSDPANPKVPRRMKAALDALEETAARIAMDKPDFSPEMVKANREALAGALDAFPRMREAAERFGLPPLTTMSAAYQEELAKRYIISRLLQDFRKGDVDTHPGLAEMVSDLITQPIDMDRIDAEPMFWGLREHFKNLSNDGTMEKLMAGMGGGYSPPNESISMNPAKAKLFIDGTRYDPTFIPERGGWSVGGNSYEDTLLHEFAHHIDVVSLKRDFRAAKTGDKEAKQRLLDRRKFESDGFDKHLATKYGQSSEREFFAEAIAAVMSGNKDAEEMLSPEARRVARQIAGFPERDPVFAGRTSLPQTFDEVLTDRFGQSWIRARDGMLEAINNAKAERSRDGVPDVLETFVDARRRTGLKPFDDVEFEHDGRKFVMHQSGDTFEIDINGRTVASASVVEGRDGLPEITNVDVLPGYEGIAPDNDLHEMVVDHARKRYPSARAPQRARKTQIMGDGFASVGPEHHDARQIDGTPGTPEYEESLATEFEAARVSGKKIFFEYNEATREVVVTEVIKKNGHWYVKGNDSLRNGEQREFRLDRVAMPKIVRNPVTGEDEVAKRPGKPPRKPVPVFTGKAAKIFEGAQSWEEVAERLGKGRYVFFDFETTGIEEGEFGEMMHPGTPTQIGLVEIIDGKVTRRWSSHVNPGRPLSIDPKTGRSWSADNLKYKDPVTGELKPISNEWLATQKPLKEGLEEMLEFIGPMDDTILGGQNHPYDDDVMKRALAFAGLDESRWNPAGFIDSQALAQSLLDKESDDYPRDPKKGYKTVSLGPLATFLGWDMGEGWHSADADSEASYEAFKRLVRRAADHENSGKPVRRDLFAPGGGEKEYAERIAEYENEKRGWDWKVKKYKEAQATQTPGDEGFASRGQLTKRASNPASWKDMTPEERDAATQASAQAAVDYLNALSDAGVDLGALRDLDRAELDAILQDLVPGGEARVSDYVTGDGKALIEVSNATMGKVFMSLGFHVQVISDDPNEQHLLENGINDMQKALQDYVKAVAKDPDALLKDRVFRDWATKQGINLEGLSDKKLEKAAKNFAEQFEINLCLYYKAGSNMLCGENIGIEREEMPQLGGRMKGDDTLAAKAIKAGLMAAKEFKLDDEKLNSLDPAKQDELRKLAKNPARVAELAKQKDPLAKELFDVLNWNDTEANVESIADKAAEAMGITVETPRFVDPATMLGAQNQLQGSKVENMADSAVKAVLEAIPVLEARLGRKPTNRELSDYLANEVKHGLFQPTLTAGLPGGQIYMLDGHHRWSGLLMANKKLEAMGIDVRVELNIKNYQTDIRSGLELGRAIQVAMGVKDAKLAGEDPFKFDPNIPELTPEEFDKAVAGILDPANLVDRLREVREGGKFRQTEKFDEFGQRARLRARRRPVRSVVDEVTGNQIMLEPQSRVKGIKPARTGYRASGSGSGWQSVEDHIKLETERGNALFDTHKEYVDKGYETAWVTHTPGEAGRYVVNAGDVGAWEAGEIEVDPADISEVDLAGATLVGTDDEGGYLYVRKKRTPRTEKIIEMLQAEEEYVDGFASMGGNDPFESVALDVVAGATVPEESIRRGGPAQRDREIVADDFDTRQRQRIAGVQVPERKFDEFGIPIPGDPIYRESMRIGRRKYTFEVDADGIVSVYTGRKYKQVAQLTLDRNHTAIGGRKPDRSRHHIDGVSVDERHRRKGIATQMAEIAEHVYGGRVEHSSALTKLGRKWRDADMERRGAPGNKPNDDFFGNGFASRGNYKPIELPGESNLGFEDSALDRLGDKLQLDEVDEPDRQMSAVSARIMSRIAGGEATLAERLGITPEQLRDRLEEIAGEINQFVDRFVNDKEVRQNVKLGYKLLSTAAFLFGVKGMKDILSTLNPDFAGGGDGSSASSNNLLSIVDQFLSAGIHEALIAYGTNFANLIATEYAAMRLVTRQKAKEMIADIRARIEGTGQKIGVMTTEMWNRLRGAWAKTRATAPIPVAAGVKEWIVAGSSPMWAELSWADYQAKSRITQRLQPSDTRQWGQIASKVGPSPELIDIATYRAGLGYGTKRVKSRDVVRVYL